MIIMDEKQKAHLLRHIEIQIEEQKREVNAHFAELKLKLPAYLKNRTIGEVRDAGGLVSPDIYLSKKAEDFLRSSFKISGKRLELLERMNDIFEQHKGQVNLHFEKLKKQLPSDLLRRKMSDLCEEDVSTLEQILNSKILAH